MDEPGLSNTACCGKEDKVNALLATERGALPSCSNEMEWLSYKVSGQMCSYAFKKRLGFSFTVINYSIFYYYKKFFINKVLKYKT